MMAPSGRRCRPASIFAIDVWNGIIKSFVFGVAVSLIAVFEGYDSVPTAEGCRGQLRALS
jgi:phospholipid/cholesterol/gamma-HCH transport system permease protein